MAQLMIIFANNEVKMELTEPKNTSNNVYYASVAVTIIANTLPLSRFVRMATYGLSYGLAQWAAVGAPTTTFMKTRPNVHAAHNSTVQYVHTFQELY